MVTTTHVAFVTRGSQSLDVTLRAADDLRRKAACRLQFHIMTDEAGLASMGPERPDDISLYDVSDRVLVSTLSTEALAWLRLFNGTRTNAERFSFHRSPKRKHRRRPRRVAPKPIRDGSPRRQRADRAAEVDLRKLRRLVVLPTRSRCSATISI